MKNVSGSSQQLTLLPSTSVPARFQLSKATRERGMRHIAEIRAQLEARRLEDLADNVRRLPPRPRDDGTDRHEAA